MQTWGSAPPHHGWYRMEVAHLPLTPASTGRQQASTAVSYWFSTILQRAALRWKMAFPCHTSSLTRASLNLESCKQSIIQRSLPSHRSRPLPPRAPSLSTDRLIQKKGCEGTASISSWPRPKSKRQWKGTWISDVPSPVIWLFALK